ncbi:alanine/glycine:cation symporter family protein [Arundinibacter roseus]|uniref:Alanine:cation symporter family protein n=1 Tax=Arundinibacter roseus TaxID=2070510 RepID=A0A4R4K821_9BACT|nr:alanine/glycine:cation symporter family protein [Arundinibacter roseus]TDB63778.1 alanine:cation symporter family protein [Arundinibacter roseus]
MKRLSSLLTLFLASLSGSSTFAQAAEGGLDKKINDMVQPATDWVSGVVFYSVQLGAEATTNMPLVIIFLLCSATFFTIYFKFINIRGFGTAIQTVKGTYSDPNDAGEVSHFQALTAAVSGTVGLGNIAGVAIAISLGGPGATFWMILAGLLGMSSKFVECTLGVKYREIGADGKVYGGPMYYLTKGLKEKGQAKLGKVLAVFFAIMCVGGSFGGGNMFQSNQAAKQFLDMTGSTSTSAGTIFGLFMAGMVALVIIGGIKRIGAVTEKIVPFMCGIYILASLVVIIVNAANLPATLGKIFGEAFSPIAVAGGFVGVLVQGFRRAAFSNEAGVGSAAIAHSAVKTDFPASEGIVALLEPFIDTVIICTMTAVVVVITGDYDNAGAMGGVEITSQSFATVIPWFPYVLTVTVVMFAFSTMISWSYYGLQAWLFLFGKTKLNDMLYKVLFCIFVVVGAAASLGAVTDFSDAMIFAMSVPNLIGLFFLLPVVKSEAAKYMAYIKSGDWKQYQSVSKK